VNLGVKRALKGKGVGLNTETDKLDENVFGKGCGNGVVVYFIFYVLKCGF
jgi:hypothetical protein